VTNDGDIPLTNISVTLFIYRTGDGGQANATHLFVIGSPDPVFQGGADGQGVIPAKSSGDAAWLFMALREAAPKFDTLYDVSGELSYAVDGVLLTVPLFPDTITVTPDPILHVKYFWEQARKQRPPPISLSPKNTHHNSPQSPCIARNMANLQTIWGRAF